MSQNDEILEKLQQLLSHKKSNQYYATKLGVSVEEIEELRKPRQGVVAPV
jgi:5'-3' exonuclease